jgi:hypothetical protein
MLDVQKVQTTSQYDFRSNHSGSATFPPAFRGGPIKRTIGRVLPKVYALPKPVVCFSGRKKLPTGENTVGRLHSASVIANDSARRGLDRCGSLRGCSQAGFFLGWVGSLKYGFHDGQCHIPMQDPVFRYERRSGLVDKMLLSLAKTSFASERSPVETKRDTVRRSAWA